MTVYVVGKLLLAAGAWEFIGVCFEEAKALSVCEGHPDYFIGPAEMDAVAPDQTVPWPGAYIPGSG